jgi:hypothetical protein
MNSPVIETVEPEAEIVTVVEIVDVTVGHVERVALGVEIVGLGVEAVDQVVIFVLGPTKQITGAWKSRRGRRARGIKRGNCRSWSNCVCMTESRSTAKGL